MARDPHEDLEAQKLQIGLRESNITMADSALEEADTHLLHAQMALAGVPDPTDTVSRLIFAQSHAALAAAMYAQVEAKMNLEGERAETAHVRAHLDHADTEQTKAARLESVRGKALDAVRRTFQDEGFDLHEVPGLGIVLRPPEDDDPRNS